MTVLFARQTRIHRNFYGKDGDWIREMPLKRGLVACVGIWYARVVKKGDPL